MWTTLIETTFSLLWISLIFCKEIDSFSDLLLRLSSYYLKEWLLNPFDENNYASNSNTLQRISALLLS